MKVIAATKEGFTFGLNAREKAFLLKTLPMFPLVPPANHQLSKAAMRGDDQRLLDEAVAEHRKENANRVKSFLTDSGRFRETQKRIELSISRMEIEWLLQVLNDIRVGAWLILDQPEDIHDVNVSPKNAGYILALETSGYFQSALLSALGYDDYTE